MGHKNSRHTGRKGSKQQAGKATATGRKGRKQQAGKAGSNRQERQEASGRKGRKHQAGSIRQERRAEEGDLPAMPDMAGTEKGASPPGLL